MAQHVGMVVTDGRVLLGSEVEDEGNLTVIPREIRVEQQTLRSDERINMVRSLVREAIERGRAPRVLPPQREHFLNVYLALADQYRHVVSVHYLSEFDGATHEARICRQLMQPYQQIDVYEAKTLEGGLEFLLKTAATLAQEDATATQLLALLRYLEAHMQTLLLTPGAIKPQPWVDVATGQRVPSMLPGTETLLHFDVKERKLVVLDQGKELHGRIGQMIQGRWGTLRYAAFVRYRGYTQQQVGQLSESLVAAGLPEPPHVEPIAATFLPCIPPAFIEILLVPTATDLTRLRSLVQDPAWWKGAA